MKRSALAVLGIGLVACAPTQRSEPRTRRTVESPAPPAAPALALAWEKDTLRISGPGIPGGEVEIWYLEAFCRSGSTDREWSKTTIPHSTELVNLSADRRQLELLSRVEGGVEVTHHITAGTDEVDFQVRATHHGESRADVSWAQPCMRVDRFTAREQADYIEKSFLVVDGTVAMLDQIERAEDALYKGGQVYVPAGIDLDDVNPRPISPVTPSAGIIGCISGDGSRLLAMAWEPCQELFQGVRVCLHSDFRLGGLEPGETRTARGKVYILKNDTEALLERHRSDLGEE